MSMWKYRKSKSDHTQDCPTPPLFPPRLWQEIVFFPAPFTQRHCWHSHLLPGNLSFVSRFAGKWQWRPNWEAVWGSERQGVFALIDEISGKKRYYPLIWPKCPFANKTCSTLTRGGRWGPYVGRGCPHITSAKLGDFTTPSPTPSLVTRQRVCVCVYFLKVYFLKVNFQKVYFQKVYF